jgi:hypothetical protein
LSFASGEAAQVDFGAGPFLADPNGTARRTWAFVMALCFSRHQYLEFVFDPSVPTWLGVDFNILREWNVCGRAGVVTAHFDRRNDSQGRLRGPY